MSMIKQTGCIYAIKNMVNNKIYIGQTRLRNPIVRWKDHYEYAYFRDAKYGLYQAMRKYGVENFTFQILETGIPLCDLDAKEKLYIAKFDSVKCGYNETIGGQDEEWHSKLTREQVIDIIDKIKNSNQSFVAIAKEYDVHPSTISDINNGDTWNFEGIKYPILNKCNKRGLSENDVQDIYSKIRSGQKTELIAREYNVSRVMISNINNGVVYRHDDEIYPICKPINSAKRLETNEVQKIINLLRTTNLTYTQISDRVRVGRKTVSNIDNGTGYKQIITQLGFTQFPIRKNN